MSSYERCVKKAGAEVLTSKWFGSYQGEAWIKVRWLDAEHWVTVAYGSCSGCDWYESEIGYGLDDEAIAEVELNIGNQVLQNLLTQEEAEAYAGRYAWDMEADQVIAWLKDNKLGE